MREALAAPIFKAAVEGIVDEAVVKKLVAHIGGAASGIYGRKGKPYLRQKSSGYNNEARTRLTPWLMLVDLDNDAECAPSFRDAWLPDPAPHLCFWVAVREVEAWLMADAESLANYLSVSQNRIPRTPESIERPKDEMVNLCRRAPRREIREDMVPRQNNGRRVGPAYASRLIEYVENKWRPEIAANHSDSLRRAILCLERLVLASS